MKLTRRLKCRPVRKYRYVPVGYYANRPHLLRTGEIGRYESVRYVTS